CYTILGVIHSKWRPVPGRFKDYIAIPKPNKYQSLHTTVVTEFGQVFEIQIRTYEMNRTAEYGIAAHWVYKEKGSVNASSDFDTKISWLREVIEIEDLKDGNEFLNNIKLNIVSDDIYVFTPKGEVLDLPIGSTCVDFAYKVHSEVGNRCIGAKVNSKMVPLNTSLENGDVVEIMTSSSGKGPSRDWLKFVTTMQAKAKIRNFLKKQLQTDNIKLGREMLERESKHKGYVLTDLLNTKNALESVMTRYSFASEDDMFASIGYGGVTTKQVLVKLIDAYQKEQVMHHPELAIKPIQQSELNKAKKKRLNGVIVEGYDDFLIKFSKCCNPVPGDNIVGYAARGTGVSIHRVDCTNIKSMEKERLMKAAWSDGDTSTFVVQLMLTCDDKSGLLNEIISLIAQLGYSISSMEVHVKSDKTQLKKAFISLGIFIRNTMDIEYIIKKLKEISNVNTITRNG
ncbi:MAG: TGS domain-containing protein, partial [Christensenellaceae bacterium]|nr:TGS domain-containing protein [Christensenellaceae bacterium]